MKEIKILEQLTGKKVILKEDKVEKTNVEKFITKMTSKYPQFSFKTSTSNPASFTKSFSPGVFVLIQGDIDILTKGLAGLGDQRKPNWGTHNAIKNLAETLGGYYDFNFSKPYVYFKT